jgi:hypothetical protein
VLGFDGAINYKTDDISARLAVLAPDGVDGAAPSHLFTSLRVRTC